MCGFWSATRIDAIAAIYQYLWGMIMSKFINMRDGEITIDPYRFSDAECTTEEDLYERHAKGSRATLTADIEAKPKGFQKKMEGGKRVFAYLDQASIDEAKKLGNGNMSEGIRIALKPIDAPHNK